MEWMKRLEIGDIVEHRVHTAKRWGFGIVKKYRRYHGIYEILWGDGTVRTHTSELLKQIA
tara:strand:- start:5 stop:184 length:180 start_codon:yes stop_codon:yes gene_type:complete